MTKHLKVIAINGSPHSQGGNTSIMTQMIAPWLAKEDIELEEIFLADQMIEFCVGCGLCIEKGTCCGGMIMPASSTRPCRPMA